jgi:hypothetical protein
LDRSPIRTYLDFEKPIAELESKVAELRALAAGIAALDARELGGQPLLELAEVHGTGVGRLGGGRIVGAYDAAGADQEGEESEQCSADQVHDVSFSDGSPFSLS